MAASSLKTGEKVASRRGSGRHWRSASRARALSESLEDLLAVVGEVAVLTLHIPEETPDNMLQQPHSLLIDQLGNHVT